MVKKTVIRRKAKKRKKEIVQLHSKPHAPQMCTELVFRANRGSAVRLNLPFQISEDLLRDEGTILLQ